LKAGPTALPALAQSALKLSNPDEKLFSTVLAAPETQFSAPENQLSCWSWRAKAASVAASPIFSTEALQEALA